MTIADQTLQIPLDQYFTVDVLTPLYVLAHNDRQNMFIDLSGLQREGLNREAVRQYSTGKRVREIEWNRVYQALQLRDGLWILNDNLCGLFMDLDVSQLMSSFEQALTKMQSYKSPVYSQKQQELRSPLIEDQAQQSNAA